MASTPTAFSFAPGNPPTRGFLNSGGFGFGRAAAHGVDFGTTSPGFTFGAPPSTPARIHSRAQDLRTSFRSKEEVQAWRGRLRKSLQEKASPEQMQQAQQAKKNRRQRQQQLARAAERLQEANAMNTAATFSGYASFGATPTASFSFGEGAGSATCQAIFGASAAPQSASERLQRVQATTDHRSPVRAAMQSAVFSATSSALTVADQENALAVTRRELQDAGHAWAALPGGAVAAVEAVTHGDGTLDALLAQLKVEPSSDEERAAKFALYETHSETLAQVRVALFDLWTQCQDDMPRAPKAATEAALRHIDRTGALGLDEAFLASGGDWFVFGMAKKATENEAKLNSVLQQIRTKLEQLSTAHECPCCLEPITGGSAGAAEGPVTLGCAHQVCADCWSHWVESCRMNQKQPFCPLCRNDEFVVDVLGTEDGEDEGDE